MRDRRFIAVHRGGLLDQDSHRLLASWAADCSESVLHLLERVSDDDRPAAAIKTGRAWANGLVKTGDAMKASVAAHAAAREATDKAAIAAARSAAQAVATAHFADHSMGALLYALKALDADGLPLQPFLQRCIDKLPIHLQDQVTSGVISRLGKLKSKL